MKFYFVGEAGDVDSRQTDNRNINSYEDANDLRQTDNRNIVSYEDADGDLESEDPVLNLENTEHRIKRRSDSLAEDCPIKNNKVDKKVKQHVESNPKDQSISLKTERTPVNRRIQIDLNKVTKCLDFKLIESTEKSKNLNVINNTAKSKVTKASENNKKKNDEFSKEDKSRNNTSISTENSPRRATRNIKTPNWKEIISGKKSLEKGATGNKWKGDAIAKVDSTKELPTTKKKRLLETRSDTTKCATPVKKLKMSNQESDNIAKKCTVKLENIDTITKKSQTPKIAVASNIHKNDTRKKVSPEKEAEMEIRKGSRRKIANSKFKDFDIENSQETPVNKSETSTQTKVLQHKVGNTEKKLNKENARTESKTSDQKTPDQERSRDHRRQKDSDDQIKPLKSNSQKKSKTPIVRSKGRPKGSKNKTLEDDDNDFEAQIEVLNYSGHSGRPKRSSIKVKVEPPDIPIKQEPQETDPVRTADELKTTKRKSRKSTKFDSVSVDSVNLSDDEDILEWKGVGEMKNRGRGRPKGSSLKKYEIIEVPTKLDNKLTASKEKQMEPELEKEDSSGIRSRSRVSYSCEVCSKKYYNKFLLNEHVQFDHPKVKEEPESGKEDGSDDKIEKGKTKKRKTADNLDSSKENSDNPKETSVSSKENSDSSKENYDNQKENSNSPKDNSDSSKENSDSPKENSAQLDIPNANTEISEANRAEIEEIDAEELDDEDGDWSMTDTEDDDDEVEVNKRTSSKKKTFKKPPSGEKLVEYSCPDCNKTFKNQVSLQVHKIVHMRKDFAFECSTCKQKFSTRSDLQSHSQISHNEDFGALKYFGFVIIDGKIQCEICSDEFESMDAYHSHRRDHLALKFLCLTCGQGFVSNEDLEKHTLSNCTENRFHLKCSVCTETFRDNESRKKHIKSLHAKQSNFICHVCGMAEEDMSTLKLHIETHQNEKIFQCEFCNKQFNEKRNLLDHRLVHSRSQEVECPTCFKVLVSQKSLQKHMHLHTIKKKFSCKFCESKFETKAESREHELKHVDNGASESTEYKCLECGRVFSNKYRLQRHSQVHKADRTFNCCFCEEQFQTGSSLLSHKKTKHAEQMKMKKQPKSLICEHCGFETFHKQRLLRHIQVHNTEKLFECEFCGKKFQTLTSCSSHKMIHRGRVREPGKKFLCKWHGCSREFIKPATLRRHLISHLFKLVTGREECGCQECAVKQTGGALHGSDVDNLEQIGSEVVLGGTVNTGGNNNDINSNMNSRGYNQATVKEGKNDSMDLLQEAISQIEEAENTSSADTQTPVTDIVVDELKENSSRKPIFPCSWCPGTFHLRCKLLDHFGKCHPEHQFPVCEDCNKVYLDNKNLAEHRSVHSGDKPFSCEVCGKFFRTKTSLRQHSHIHTENKPYVCSHCGHGFTQRGYFLEHVRRHTGERPYICNICHKGFVSNDLRKRHMYLHTGNKPHQCTHCGKSFVDKSLLIVHLRTHANYRPYQCGKCDKAFYANSKLQRHLASVHHIDKATLSDYFPTKLNKGVGWRHKNKANREKIKPETQYVVYIDQHGNIISKVETRAAEKFNNLVPIIDTKEDEEEVLEMDEEEQEHDEVEAELEVVNEEEGQKEGQEEPVMQNIQVVNKSEQGFIPIGGAIEVHTRRDASGQLQVFAVPDNKRKNPQEETYVAGKVPAERAVSNEHEQTIHVQEPDGTVQVLKLAAGEAAAQVPMEVIQMQTHSETEAPVEYIQMATNDGTEEAGEGTQYATIIAEDGSTVHQHLELITHALTGNQDELDNEQHALEIVSEVESEQANVTVNGDQNMEIYSQAETEAGLGNIEQISEDISINIGEDGTVNVADLEKIEALRNLYSDGQIVIVLENQEQQVEAS